MKTIFNLMTKLIYTMMGMMMFVGMVGSGSAHAETKMTTYPGTMCQPYLSKDANNIGTWVRGVFNNSTTSSAMVVCPIPKTVSNGRLSSVIVHVEDESDSSSIACSAWVYDLDGEFVFTKPGNSDQFFGGNNNVFIQNMNYAGNSASYNLFCILPKRISGVTTFVINSYEVKETN